MQERFSIQPLFRSIKKLMLLFSYHIMYGGAKDFAFHLLFLGKKYVICIFEVFLFLSRFYVNIFFGLIPNLQFELYCVRNVRCSIFFVYFTPYITNNLCHSELLKRSIFVLHISSFEDNIDILEF